MRDEIEALRDEVAALRAEKAALLAERDEARARQQRLLEQSQLLVRELDVQPLLERFQTLQAQGITDFRAYFDAHPEEVARCARLTRVRYANRNILDFYGAKDGEELQDALLKEMSPEHYDIATKLFVAFMEGRALPSFETTVRTLRGEEKYLMAQVSALENNPLTGPSVSFIAIDATQWRQAEMARRAGEERFQRLVEILPDAVVIHNGAVFTYANPAGLQLLGAKTLADIADKNILDFVVPAFHEAVMDRVQNIPAAGEPVSPMYRRLRRLDGSALDAEVNGATYTDADGRHLHIVVIRDITERHQAEAALRDRETLYRRVIAAADAVAYQVEEKTGRYKFISEEIQNLTGYRADEITALTWHDMEGSSVMRGGREGLDVGDAVAMLRAGKMDRWKADYRIRHTDGHWRWLSDSAIPLFDETGKYIGSMGILQDITERKQLEEQLLQAQKMESLGRLAGGVAHDFNNLLAAIIGYTELALLEHPEDNEVHDYLCKINSAAERAAGVTGQLLTFARKQRITPKSCDLGRLLESMAELLRHPLGEDIRLQTHIEDGLWPVLIDPGQFEQALLNLTINARDAMPRGGNLDITLENFTQSDGNGPLPHTLRPGDYVRITVKDTGTGMEAGVLKHIFEPFYTTRPAGKGTGLGLAIVQGIVEQNGGHIRVDSSPGHGTTFALYLPRIQMPVTEQAGISVQERRSGTETILLVEDEAVVRDMAATALRRNGYTVFTATGGEEAIAIAEGLEQEIHLLLTDVVMPTMGGGETARRVAGLRPGIKVLFTTGYTDDPLLKQETLPPRFPLLQKPYSLSLLMHHVRAALEGSPFESLNPGYANG